MARVGIVTESSTVLPRDLADELGIRVASLGYVYENKVYRDYLDITTEDFWKIFPTFKNLPTTSAVSLGDFRNIFLDMGRQTKSIVCITMSKSLSATYKAAEQAAQIVMEENPAIEIKVIDSQTGSGATGLIVLEAARAARAGKSLEEVVQTVEDLMPRTKYFMVLETLKYIMQIGRAPGEKSPGPVPQISPIMGIVKTGTGVLEKLDRGADIDQALARAMDMVGNYIDVKKPVRFLLAYPDRIEQCEPLKKVLEDKYNCAEILMGQLTPSMLVSCGPMFILAFHNL